VAADAKNKLVRGLLRLPDGRDAKVGVLVPDCASESTPSPLAVVCELRRVPTAQTLHEVHRLAWNLCKSPLLMTLDPSGIRAWSCCEIPAEAPQLLPAQAEIEDARYEWKSRSLSEQVASALHWVNLLSGRLLHQHAARFRPSGRADQILLSNLRSIRHQLHSAGLSYELAHDLIGRIIFIQFLFQRADSGGRAALDRTRLHTLTEDGVLRGEYGHLQEILGEYEDCYSFFRWLDLRFNGDLFPGKGGSLAEREREWHKEMSVVRPEHLTLLADFVGGGIRLESGQRSLFPLYSFDTIPLEFISSIYEEFVGPSRRTTGAHYTPSYIVELMLDGALPWSDSRWDLKILDPACGSGIFLVKAYQRLVHRWRVRHVGEQPSAATLRGILENSIFGVDINPEAVRVASFSLYLAMCDEIDPKYYWTQVRFPRLRGRNLHPGDFFALRDDRPDLDRNRFDLIIGNAPWGQATVTTSASEWAAGAKWTTSYGTLGPLFLAKAAELGAPNAPVSLLQPLSFLTNSVKTARTFRQRLFSELKVEEIVNLGALRFGLFANAVDPACIVTLRCSSPDGNPISYICPKPTRSTLDDYRLTMGAGDVQFLTRQQALDEPHIWSAFMWGGRRDLSLIKRLANWPALRSAEAQGGVRTREGIIRGDRKRRIQALLGRRILADGGEENLHFYVDAQKLPVNDDDRVDSRASTDLSAFELPQLIVKQGWTKRTGRFQAALVRNSPDGRGLLCSQSYLSITADRDREALLKGACVVFNSVLAVYYLLLTSGRFATYRPEPTARDFLSVPIPALDELPKHGAPAEIDDAVRQVFGLSEADWWLIQDLFNYTLPDFKGDSRSPGRLPTRRGEADDEASVYCETCVRVLRSGFGRDKRISATVFEETPGSSQLPVRLVVLHLDSDKGQKPEVRRERMDGARLLTTLADFARTTAAFTVDQATAATARVYHTMRYNGRSVPSVIIVKPDQVRHWCRSAALADADAVAGDIVAWGARSSGRGQRLAD